jgi:hypothetical protein
MVRRRKMETNTQTVTHLKASFDDDPSEEARWLPI